MGEGDFSAFFQRRRDRYAEKSRLDDGLNRGQRRGFRAELGIDDGEDGWPIYVYGL